MTRIDISTSARSMNGAAITTVLTVVRHPAYATMKTVRPVRATPAKALPLRQ